MEEEPTNWSADTSDNGRFLQQNFLRDQLNLARMLTGICIGTAGIKFVENLALCWLSLNINNPGT
jgi:hypothetical protein